MEIDKFEIDVIRGYLKINLVSLHLLYSTFNVSALKKNHDKFETLVVYQLISHLHIFCVQISAKTALNLSILYLESILKTQP